MFPDPTALWTDYPSPIDGVAPPPYAFDLGIHRGVLRIAVSPPDASIGNHFRIEIDCEMYFGVEEMIYSTAGHAGSSANTRKSYIRQATSSRMLDFWRENDPFERSAKHFIFVGADFCYECLGLSDPVIYVFRTEAEARDWERT